MRSPSIGVDSARGIEKEAPHTHRLVVARQYADQGGLAGAVRAQQADDLTRGDVEVDIAQRGKVPVVLVGLWHIRTGDCRFRAQKRPRPAFFSVAKLGGSDSLSIFLCVLRIRPPASIVDIRVI